MKNLRLLLADDHDVVREGLVAMLNSTDGLEVTAHTSSGQEAVSLARSLQPDIALLDVSMPDLSGIEATRQIAAHSKQIRIMALTMHADADFAYQILEAGAHGYWLKESTFSELVAAIRRLAAGEEVIAERVAQGVERKRAEGADPSAEGADELTFRERQVLQLVCQGFSSKQIGKLLKISTRTVEQHRAHLMDKSGLSNAAGLVNWAVINKLVAPPV